MNSPESGASLPATSRVERSRRERERRRRQRRRLLPMVIAVVVIVGAIAWLAIGPKDTSSASAAGSTSSSTSSTTTTTIPVYVPSKIKLLYGPALSGEGKWNTKDAWSKNGPNVSTTFFRVAPSVYAYAAWMRSGTTQLALYPGYKGPGVTSLPRGPMEVPLAARGRLLATFNSGFYESDSPAGFYTHGTLYFPLIRNEATLVEYTNLKVSVINWTYGTKPPLNVLMARQNLHLLVNNSQPAAGLSVGSNWGITLHGVPDVWRTGVGVDAHGNLIYAAADHQTAASLAQIFIRLGCVRAMQLDINPEWPIFVTYGAPGAGNPTLDVPNPNQVRSRFLYSSTKDFFALYSRSPGQIQVPW